MGGKMGGLLEGKKILVTGVLDRRSIAYSAARLAQEQGAEIALSGFGRAKRLTERTAKRLDPEPPILELDVNKPEDIAAVAEDLDERWEQSRRDRARHRLRPRRRPRRQLPHRRVALRRHRPPDFGLLLESPHRRPRRRSRRRSFRRRAGLRRQDRLAGLRLDGGGQSRPGKHLALPRPRPRGARHQGQPRLGGPDQDARRERHQRLRGDRRRVGTPGAPGLGDDRTQNPSEGPS